MLKLIVVCLIPFAAVSMSLPPLGGRVDPDFSHFKSHLRVASNTDVRPASDSVQGYFTQVFFNSTTTTLAVVPITLMPRAGNRILAFLEQLLEVIFLP